MSSESVRDLKAAVRDYWNAEPCGTPTASAPALSRGYFEQIEAHRYDVEPEIHSFAQFTRWRGRAVLEVGVGAGTDFVQWCRAGSVAHGVDLTPAAIEHVRARLAIEGLSAADLRMADAEALPYGENSFDCVYSWGVIHHSPNTERALAELVRVAKPGAVIKVMVYNRHSIHAILLWIRHALLRGKPWRSIAWVQWHHQESPGTKAYTLSEWRRICEREPVSVHRLSAPPTAYDIGRGKSWLRRFVGGCLVRLIGQDRCGFFLLTELRKAPATG